MIPPLHSLQFSVKYLYGTCLTLCAITSDRLFLMWWIRKKSFVLCLVNTVYTYMCIYLFVCALICFHTSCTGNHNEFGLPTYILCNLSFMCVGKHGESVAEYTSEHNLFALLVVLFMYVDSYDWSSCHFLHWQPWCSLVGLNYVTCKKRRFQKGVRRKDGTDEGICSDHISSLTY
jgi:hypothetical protein